jgi:hypothetical protein
MKRPLLALLLITIAGSPAASVEHSSTTAKSVSDRDRAVVGELTVLQIATNDADRLLAEWAQPTPPNLTTNTRIERNKPIHSFLVVGGCRRDEGGSCDVIANYEVLDPDGAVYARQADAILLNGPAPGFAASLRLSQSSLALIIEDGEKLGNYLVKAEVIDRNAKLTAHTELMLAVVEAGTVP